MKHVMRLSFLGILLFSIIGCKKHQDVTELHKQESTGPESAAYMLDLNTNKEQPSMHALTKGELDFAEGREQKFLKLNKKGNTTMHHAHGIVTTPTPNTLVFSAVEENGKVHGKNQLDGAYFNNVQFNSECLTVDSNRSYFGGAITSWEAGPGFPANAPPVSEGWELYMAAEDNGEGNNAMDAFGGGLVFFPPGTTLADIEQQYGFPQGFFAAQGIQSKCDFAAFLYSQGQVPYLFVTGEKPTNVQVK